MSNLSALQSDFQAYLTVPTYGDFEQKKARMISYVAKQKEIDTLSRLEIYYDMYRLRLLDVLFTDYPKLVGLMREENFTQAFLHYLLHYPSTHYSVRPFGAKFSEFLAQFEPFCFKDYYAEMAAFEWALSLTFDAADVPPTRFEHLKKLPPENWVDLKFKLHPSVSLLTLNYNTVPVWKILDAQKILPEQEDESILERYPEENPERFIEVLSAPQAWLIWRQDLTTRFQTLTTEAYFMLTAIQQTLSFSEVCEKLTQIMEPDTVASFAIHHLSDWLNTDVLTQY